MTFLPLAVAAALALPQLSPDPFEYRIVEVGPGVIAFMETGQNGIVSGNVVAVIGRDAVLVFDTGHHPLSSRRMIEDLRRFTDRPVRWVVVSHWHDDHWVGTAEFTDGWPGAEVLAHPFTARLMDDRKDKFRGAACKAELAADMKPLEEMRSTGKRPDGTPVSEASRARLDRFLAAGAAQAAQCDTMRYRAVDATVDHERTLDLGGRTVELRHLGRGNTAGDLVAWLPESRTVLTGDLVVHPFPFATQSYITEWAATLRLVDRLDPRVIVPGHGAVQRDRSYLLDLVGVLESIARQARAAWTPGMTADQLREAVNLDDWREKFSRGDAFIRANFDAMMKGPAIDRMWQELSGQWKPEGG